MATRFEQFLSELDYPAKREIIIERAVAHGADEEEVRRALTDVPTEEFNSPNNVTEALSRVSWPGA